MKRNDIITEKTYSLLFKIGLSIKALIAIGEVTLGVLFYTTGTTTINKIFYFFAGNEVTEQPPDFYWTYVLHGYQSLVGNGQLLWAFIFLSHGILNLFLIFALLKNKIWAYPAAAAIFSLFVIYQLYNIFQAVSISLVLFTIVDVIVIGLVIHEYHYKRRALGK
jgi:uncharacterized membrane protein